MKAILHTPPKPSDPIKQKTGEGCPEATCSPSYVPFGEAWEKEVMKNPKSAIVAMLRKACVERDNTRGENAMCKTALQNLSACCYGQNLTQSVAGAIELITEYRKTDRELRARIEELEGLLPENDLAQTRRAGD